MAGVTFKSTKMFRKSLVSVVIVLALILVRISFSSAERYARIHGGAVAKATDFPWTVSLRFNNWHCCGGTILNQRIILTAAHCVKPFRQESLSVRVGSVARTSGGQVIAIEDVSYHQQFDQETLDYDIALLRLTDEIEITPNAQPIALATTDEDVRDGDTGYISGWGLREDNSLPLCLEFLEVMVYNRSICSELLDVNVTERMICAGDPESGKNSCSGDSGGPLVVNGKLVGISSWGPECGDPLKPDVYTKVSMLMPWVTEQLNLFGESLE